MDLIVDKLGRIEHAEIAIRPLTVFVGENNTNKTWAAYCLHGVARHLAWSWSGPEFGQAALPLGAALGDRIERAARQLVAAIPEQVDVYDVSATRRDLIDEPREPVTFACDTELIRRILRLTDEVAADARASLRVSPREFTSGDYKAHIALSRTNRFVTSQFVGMGHTESYAWRPSPTAPEREMIEHVVDLLRAFACRFLGRGRVLALPSERKALATTYKMLSREFEEAVPRPVFEFVEFLRASENTLPSLREGTAFLDAVGHLEASILAGAIKFQGVAAGLRLAYFLRSGGVLPMHAASSLVRALAGLDVYLRYFANPGDLLIIDEPEMNAHPEAQLRIIELLAILVNKGVRVVLTTHSPYIVDHLDNLICARDLKESDQGEVAPLFKLKTKEAFLRADDVEVYDFTAESESAPVIVKPTLDREKHIIDWTTFGRASDYVTNLYGGELLERLYRDKEAAE